MSVSHVPLPPLDEIRFYLPFPDGTLHYDCPSCTALCCRGKGFAGSLKREVPQLLQIYPALAASVTERRGNIVSFHNPANDCFFLADDNRCKIELEHGFAWKPGVCGLFPFNNFSRLASGIVVLGPHFLCPLQVVAPARPGWAAGTHEAIQNAAIASGLLDSGSFGARRPPTFETGERADQALLREEAFRNQCGEAIGRIAFREFLAAQSESMDELTTWLDRAAALLQLNTHDGPADYFDSMFLVLAPVWRLDLLKMESAQALRVLALAERLMRHAMFAEGVTPQQLNQFFRRFLPILKMLAKGDTSSGFSVSQMRAPNIGEPALAVASMRVLSDSMRMGVLQALEQHMPRGLQQVDRFALMAELSSQLTARP